MMTKVGAMEKMLRFVRSTQHIEGSNSSFGGARCGLACLVGRKLFATNFIFGGIDKSEWHEVNKYKIKNLLGASTVIKHNVFPPPKRS